MPCATYKAIVLGLGIITMCSCTDNQPLMSYYFPEDHTVFVYNSNDSFGIEYWEVVPGDKDKLTTLIYSGGFDTTQITYESVYSNGINLDSLIIYQQGSRISTEVASGFIFPFEAIDSTEVLLYRVSWETTAIDGNTVTYEIIRNRRFSGFQKKEVLGETRLCAVFRLDERIISDADGSLEIETSGEEWYAKSLGMVYRRRTISPEIQMELRLLKTLKPQEFNALR